MEFIDLAAQYQHLKSRIDARIARVLEHGKYILGPEVQEFEAAIADYTGTQFVTAVANGTDALQMALMALEIGPGDAVFAPTFTFFATAEVIALVGAEPVFVDINPSTYNMCSQSLAAAIDATTAAGRVKPAAVITVDLFGLPADYYAIEPVSRQRGLAIIEDAAQGFGGSIRGQVAGTFGDIATTSFFPAKPLGCYGDGGAVLTNRIDLHERIRSLYVHGKGTDKYDNVRIGLNSRLDTIQAAILLEKLAAFPWELEQRQRVADCYARGLGDTFVTPHVPIGFASSWAQYTVRPRTGRREEHMRRLAARGIPTAVYYSRNLHQQTAFAHLDKHGPLNHAETAASEVFSLPMHPYLAVNEQNRIIDALVG